SGKAARRAWKLASPAASAGGKQAASRAVTAARSAGVAVRISIGYRPPWVFSPVYHTGGGQGKGRGPQREKHRSRENPAPVLASIAQVLVHQEDHGFPRPAQGPPED